MNDACTFETRRSSRDSGYSEDGPRIQTTWRRTGYFSDPPYPHQECSTRKSTPWFGIRQTERDISCLQDSCASPGKAIVKGRPPGRKRGTSSIPTRSVSKGQLPSQPEASARDNSHPNPSRQQGTTPIPTRSVSKGPSYAASMRLFDWISSKIRIHVSKELEAIVRGLQERLRSRIMYLHFRDREVRIDVSPENHAECHFRDESLGRTLLGFPSLCVVPRHCQMSQPVSTSRRQDLDRALAFRTHYWLAGPWRWLSTRSPSQRNLAQRYRRSL